LGVKKIQSVTFSVEKAEIDQVRGTGTNRDVVEATNSLTAAKNELRKLKTQNATSQIVKKQLRSRLWLRRF
jgi:hypothetical protein